MQKDITIKLASDFDISWKKILEEDLDPVMLKLGFTRCGSGVLEDGSAEIYYRQFAVANSNNEEQK